MHIWKRIPYTFSLSRLPSLTENSLAKHLLGRQPAAPALAAATSADPSSADHPPVNHPAVNHPSVNHQGGGEQSLTSEPTPPPASGAGDGLLSYRIEGHGPPLLLLHGFGISFKIWRNLLPFLTPRFQCVMVELPGIGQSPPPDPARPYYLVCAHEIERLRRYLRIDQWAVFSYSTGSRAAETYIDRHPERVTRAIFLCPVHVPGWRWMAAQAALRLDSYFPSIGDWMLSGRRLHSLVRTLGFNGRGHPYARDWTREISRQDVTSLKRAIRDMPNAGEHLLELPVPALYVWGKYDLIPNRPRRRLRRQHAPIHRRIPANHSAPELAADYVAKEVLPFLSL